MSIQHLRCKVNFQALVFAPHINTFGETLVNRLRHPPTINQVARTEYSQGAISEIGKHGAGKYVVLHLRFDKV